MLNNYKDLILIEGGASQKKISRYYKKNSSFIILDFSEDTEEFKNHLIIYDILKNINISIPKIFEVDFKNHIIVTEDFGDQRFDKILNKYDINSLLESAVESLIVLNNATINSINLSNLNQYNYEIFKKEISELIDFYCPFKKIDDSISLVFYEVWEEQYQKLNFEFNSFVHKDFELSNLMHLPKNNKHLQCGILDFQSAFIGFKGWDLFSLLENSRIYFSTDKNEKFIKHYYKNTNPNIDLDSFRKQYYFLNTARQTRLLGRWVKFYIIDKNNSYLPYIYTTIKRLKSSLDNLGIKQMNSIYDKILN